MALRNLFFITIILCLFLTGCKTENTSRAIHQQKSENVIEVVFTEPSNPAKLALGQKLNIHILYELNTVEKAAIWARPYNNGKRAAGYNAHHLIYVKKEDGNNGVVTGWFYFDRPTEIDEIRVFLRDIETDKTIKEISHPITAKWL